MTDYTRLDGPRRLGDIGLEGSGLVGLAIQMGGYPVPGRTYDWIVATAREIISSNDPEKIIVDKTERRIFAEIKLSLPEIKYEEEVLKSIEEFKTRSDHSIDLNNKNVAHFLKDLSAAVTEKKIQGSLF